MKKVKGLLFCLCLFLGISDVFGTHITGAELTYECINPTTRTYRVEVTVYRDCANGQANFDNTIRLFVFRGTNGSLYTTIPINLSSSGIEIIPVDWDACTGAPYNLCVEYTTYATNITLPQLAGGYNIGWARCCRNNIVTNIFNNQGITVIGHVPGTNISGCNSMPTFNSLPPIFLCANQPFNFDHSATDIDGDSLVYAISNPFTGTNTAGLGATQFAPVVNQFGNPMGPPPYNNVNYQPGFTFNDPFGSGNFSIDPSSGLLTLTPLSTGLSVFALSVFEYRNGVLISENKRDFQISVINCAPQGNEPIITNNTTPVPGSNGDTVFVVPSQSFCYDVTVQDPSPLDTVILFPVSAAFGIGGTAPLPYATLNYIGQNPAVGQVCWTVPCENAGDTILLIVGGRDTSDCPGYNIVFDTTYVIVDTISIPDITFTLPPGSSNDTMTVDSNEPFCFDYFSSDLDPLDVLEVLPLEGPFSTLGGPPPYATVSTIGINPISGQVCWTAPCSENGDTVRFVIRVQDSNLCNAGVKDTVMVIINPLNPAGANDGDTICLGQSLNLLAFGGGTYSWSPPQGLNNPVSATPVATPAITTTYTVQITDAFGCVRTDSATVLVNPLPTVNAGADVIKCPGIPAQLQATGGITYVWSPTTGLSNPNISNPTANPLDTVTYTVTVTDTNGCVNTDQITVTPMYAIASADVAICIGDSTPISALGGTMYSWAPATGLSNPNISNPTAKPTVTTVYTVTVTDANGCTDTDQVTVTINPLPPANAGADQPLCIGDTTTLSASGGIIYLWNLDPTLTSPNSSTPSVFPIIDTDYIVTVTDGNGCSDTDTTTITINPLPIVDAGNDTAKCGNAGVPLLANGGISYQWLPVLGLDNPNIASPIANPDSSTMYYVAVTDINGCINIDSVFVRAMHANAGPDIPLCIGDSITLNASGGIAYQWDASPDLINLSSQTPLAFPTVTSDFYVTVTDISGCTDRDTVTVTVNPLPTTTTFGTDPWVCSGGGTVVNATGGVSYQWMPAAIFDDPTIGSPTAFPTYSGTTLDSTWTFYVIVTDANGCSSLDSLDQVVRVLPVVSVSNDTTKCPTDVIQLSSSGGITFSWDPPTGLNNPNISNPTANPDTTTTYTVTVTAVWGCADSSDVTITVIDPNAGMDTTICARDSVQLLATGGVSYLWNNAATLTDPTIANPTAFPLTTTSYVVSVTDAFGCVDSDTVVVFVNQLPPANAGLDQPICIGNTTQLNASGGISYIWEPVDSLSDALIPNPFANPTMTTNYIVAVTDANGCTERDTMILTVNPLPLADAGPTLTKCGEPAVQLSASGGTIYSWSPNLSLTDPNIADPFASPDSNTLYTVTVTDANGCVNTDSVQVLTMYAVAGPDQIKCPETTVQLTASTIGGFPTSFIWTPVTGLSDPLISNPTASPLTTLDYIVSITDSSGCRDRDTVQVFVYTAPPASAGEDMEVCIGETAQLNATGGVIFSWTPTGPLNDPRISTPIADTKVSTEFFVTVTDVNGCQAIDSMELTINPLPIVDAGTDVSICRRDAVPLVASGATQYVWSPESGLSDPTSEDPLAFPETTTLYTVTGTDDNGCVNTDEIEVTVWQLLSIEADSSHDICLAQSVDLEASGAIDYGWSTGSTNSSIEVTPRVSTTYWVIPYEEHGCPGDTFYIDVYVEQNLPRADFAASPEEGPYPLEVVFENQSLFSSNYLWEFGNGDTSSMMNPTYTYNLPGEYDVTLTADNDIGCANSYTFSFINALDFNIFYPNAFTPNNDGHNDEFLIVMNSIEFFEIQIFDRWGQMVYQANDPNFRWDGTKNGNPVHEGVFVYKINAVTFKGERVQRGGSVTLIR